MEKLKAYLFLVLCSLSILIQDASAYKCMKIDSDQKQE